MELLLVLNNVGIFMELIRNYVASWLVFMTNALDNFIDLQKHGINLRFVRGKDLNPCLGPN